MTLIRVFCLFFVLTAAAFAQTAPAVALYYGHKTPLKEFRVFDIIVVEPDHGYDPKRHARADSQLFAYVSVAEVQASRAHFKDIPEDWKLARNGDWNSIVIDQTPDTWPAFFAERVVAPLWEKGYRGFFLDTLDSYRLAKHFDETAQQRGLVRVIETLHARYPGITLILNRGFEIVPQVRDKVFMVAAESLYQGWNAGNKRYEPVKPADRDWLLSQLKTIRERDGIPILAIDYVTPHDRKLSRETAHKIKELGFTPWVTDAKLESIGIGAIEVQPRRILIAYDSRESPSLNYSTAHRFLQMPLNHLGYVVDYLDVNSQALPTEPLNDRYAGIVSWFSGGLSDSTSAGFARWLRTQIQNGMPFAVVGNFGFGLSRELAKALSLKSLTQLPQGPVRVVSAHKMMGFEAKPLPTSDLTPLALDSTLATPLIEAIDSKDTRYIGGAITPWGGFILNPFAISDVPGTEYFRWVIDPFAFLQASLKLPAIPAPDVTTENGRRLFFSHVDGDGFPSLAELPGSPTAAEVMLNEVLERYRIPTTVSVIEAEVSPAGLHKKLSPKLEEVARRIFKLPHVEIASHTYAHPFRWDHSVRHGVFKDATDEYYHLDVPGYKFDLHREIVGSMNYIQERLAPNGKPVKILLWSGDTAPGPQALQIAENAGFLNMNGGDTSITKQNPTLTEVGALGIEKGGFLQVYAPITNENIYTNLWRGPFYGYQHVIETFEMTEKPRRLKPVDIYYHTYSASKRAGLNALHKAFAWAKSQTLHPLFASEYMLKVRDFHDLVIARDNDGWRIRGNGDLRTLRLADEQPRLENARGLAGFNEGHEGKYIHLTSGSAWFETEAKGNSAPPRLVDANARIADWAQDGKNIDFRLKGYVPLEFSLAGIENCNILANDKPLVATRIPRLGDLATQHYRHADATAQIKIRCPGR